MNDVKTMSGVDVPLLVCLLQDGSNPEQQKKARKLYQQLMQEHASKPPSIPSAFPFDNEEVYIFSLSFDEQIVLTAFSLGAHA